MTNLDETLEVAGQAVANGQLGVARQLLMDLVRSPAGAQSGRAWHLLGQVLTDPAQRADCQQRAAKLGYVPPPTPSPSALSTTYTTANTAVPSSSSRSAPAPAPMPSAPQPQHATSPAPGQTKTPEPALVSKSAPAAPTGGPGVVEIATARTQYQIAKQAAGATGSSAGAGMLWILVGVMFVLVGVSMPGLFDAWLIPFFVLATGLIGGGLWRRQRAAAGQPAARAELDRLSQQFIAWNVAPEEPIVQAAVSSATTLVRSYTSPQAFARDAEKLSTQGWRIVSTMNHAPRAGIGRIALLGFGALVFRPKHQIVVTYGR